MTDDDKRRQMADLLLEYHEAEKELAHLKESGQRAVERLEEVAFWLKQIVTDMTEVGPMGEFYTHGKKHNINEPKFREAMNFDDTKRLADEISQLQAKIRSLQGRKESLGLK